MAPLTYVRTCGLRKFDRATVRWKHYKRPRAQSSTGCCVSPSLYSLHELNIHTADRACLYDSTGEPLDIF
jgi:hypothetical protein